MRARMAVVASINVGRARHLDGAGITGIDKRPVAEPVEVRAPGPKHGGLGSGLVGDVVYDQRHHGGDDQAVYAYAREDLDWWSAELGRDLTNGCFGENLTTSGLEVTGARIGERWRIGSEVVLEVSVPRIPCSTFTTWLGSVVGSRRSPAVPLPAPTSGSSSQAGYEPGTRSRWWSAPATTSRSGWPSAR